VEPLERVFLIESHDEAYYIWRDAGVTERTLVHIDAHHDMWWVRDGQTVAIDNFICPALKQDLLREVFWIVPDAALQGPKNRKSILQHMKRIQREYGGASNLLFEDYRITASILGKKLTICTFPFLAPLHDAVLLDIDVDYLVIPRVAYAERDRHSLLPWCWPSDLVDRLRAAGVRSDMVTVACSVEGGYTPLKWKYLGEELVLRMKQPLGAGSDLAGMRHMRIAAEAEQEGHAVQAEAEYRQAQKLLPKAAAAPYRLARLLASLGTIEEGRLLYKEAIGLDGSYKGPYSSTGFHCYFSDDLTGAEQEFQALSRLDPTDAYSRLGLGLLACKRGHWKEAERHLTAALALDDRLPDAQRVLGDVLAKLGRTSEAILACEQALKLGLAHHKSLQSPILTYATGQALCGPWHFAMHARLAELYAQQGATQKAIDGFRISIAGGSDSANYRLQLALLYWKQGKRCDTAVQCWRAIKLALWNTYFRGKKNLQLTVRLSERSWLFRHSSRSIESVTPVVPPQ
jgi:tetratricopeptide (TPR) repeat protein